MQRLTVAQHWRAIWPVLDESRTLSELVGEASDQLPGMFARARLRPIGRPRWSVRPGADIPGSGGAATVLVADVPVTAVPRDVDTVTGERDRDRRAQRPTAGVRAPRAVSA